jgi:WD40 repeat protein/transcriptional regulator with XRE-family HTH domain
MNHDHLFGQQVRQRRRSLDLTQEELARRVGCAAITLRKIEAGDLRPSQQVAERLAMALAIPLDERAEFVRQARSVQPGGHPIEPTPTPQVMPEEIGLEDLSGRAIRGYQLNEKIGAGSFGAVYRGVQPLVERDVAIKIVLPQYANHPDFIRRFEAEAQMVARLEHPHIVPLYDYWREPGVAYLVMRLLRGGNVEDLLRSGPLPLDLITGLLEQIVAALHVAHRAGVIHRDLKPSNVLLDEDRNAYLADFGIAKNLGNPDEQTQVGMIIGSPAYISPEQVRSEPVRPQADIYSLGVMLYEMLTGAKPFVGPTPLDLIQQHLYSPLPPLSAQRPGLPAALDDIIAHATAKNPDERYADVETLLIDFRAALHAEPALVPHPIVSAPSIEIVNPYKGLRPFAEIDAADFYGREALTQQLLARLGEGGDLSRFLAVIGPSGSGKSSVVGAGLVPALRRGGLPRSENWFIVEVLPGPHPLEELEAALLRVAVNPPESLLAQIKEDRRGLLRAIQRTLPADPNIELVLVLDQFEEVFTLVADETERAHLLDCLVATVLDERSRARIIITLRADFIDKPLRYMDFGELLQRRSELVLPLTPDEMEHAIVGPAQRVGLQMEAGLAEAIIADVNEQPGALPLLQYALTELFDQRSGSLLTKASYQTMGGVKGALGRRAEELYQALAESAQAIARQVLLRLVTLGEGTEDTRRRVLRSELESLSGSISNQKSTIKNVLDAFGKARLLSFDRDLQTRGPTVEVAHEALLREWLRLHTWLTESRADVRMQRLLANEATEWLKAHREASFLLRGSRLQQFEDWGRTTSITLTSDERSYLNASLDERERQRQAEEDRRAREVKLEHRAKRVLQGLVAMAIIAAIISGTLALIAANREQEAQVQRQEALTQRQEAETQRQAALDNLQSSEAQRLAAEANRLLSEGRDNETVALLALRSLQFQYTPQGDEALGGAARLNFPVKIFTGHTNNVRDIVFTKDGQTMFTASDDGIPRMWEVATGKEIRQFVGHPQGVFNLALSPDERYLLTSGDDVAARLWDVATGKEIRQFAHTGNVWGVDYSPDGQYVLTGGFDGEVWLWNASTGEKVRNFTGHKGAVLNVTYSPDGKLIATAGEDLTVKLWDAATGQEIKSLTGHGDWPWALAFSPDGRQLATGGWDKTARIWDVVTGQELKRFNHTGIVLTVLSFSPDGRYLLTGGETNAAHLWDVETDEEIQRYAHPTTVSGVAFTPDGHSIATGSFDKLARLWDITPQTVPPQIPIRVSSVNEVALSPDGSTVLAALSDFTARLWDVQTGEQRQIFEGYTAPAYFVDFSADGRTALVSALDGSLRVWDVQSGQTVQRITDLSGLYGATISPDGKTIVSTQMGTDGPEIRVWDTASGRELRYMDQGTNINNVTISPDSKMLMVGACDSAAHLWDLATGVEVRKFAFPAGNHCVNSMAFSADGQYVATAGIEGRAWLWNVASGEKVREFVGHAGIVWAVALSKDGRYAVTSGADGTARVWDVATGEELRRYAGHKAGIFGVDISADGSLVATGGVDGTVRLWYTDLNRTVDDICRRLIRDFSDDERERYNINDERPTCPSK